MLTRASLMGVGVSNSISMHNQYGRYRLAMALDSLTDGAGSASYRQTLIPALKTLYGDAGFGYMCCDFGQFIDLDQSFSKTGGVSYGTATTTIDSRGRWTGTGATQRNKSPGGKCLYTIGAAGTDSWSTNIKPTDQAPYAPTGTLQNSYGYDRCTLYFEIAPGASFSYRQNNAGTGTRIAVNDSNTPTNSIQSVTLVQNASFNTSMACDLITGDCIFYGVEYWKSTAPNQPGVMATNLAQGGQELASWGGMDDTYQRNWASLLKFDGYLLDCGMNDRLTRPASDFSADLAAVVGQMASAGGKVLLINCNQSSDYATSYLPAYEPVRLAQTKATPGAGLVSDVSVLGTYAQAVANSLMLDGVHPNSAGDALRAGLYQGAMRFN